MRTAGATDPGLGFSPGPLPRLLRYGSWAVLAACIVMTFVGAWRIGATMDEPIHVQRFNNYLESGWYLADGQLDHGRPGPQMTQQYVYGPATMLILHAVNAVAGVEPWDHAGISAHAYAVRHVSVGVIGLVGILAVILTGRVLFRRWDWGVLAGAVIAAVPQWTGHSMFNVKDVPVGTGYSLATLGLVLLARDGRAPRWAVRLGVPVLLVLGSVLAVGTRPAMWSGIVFGCVVLLAARMLRREPERLADRVRSDLWIGRDLAIAGVVSWSLLWWMDPKIFGSPVAALVKSVHSSSDFLGTSVPAWTVPLLVAFQMPVVVVCLALLGAAVVARRALRARLRPSLVETRWLIVGAQAFAMPVGVMVTQAPVYGDLRQVLFAAPATALLAVLGVSSMLGSVPALRDRQIGSMIGVVTVGGLVIPVAAQGLLFPYNYTFVNPLAAAADLHFSGEYYGGSTKELAPELPVTGRIVCWPESDDQGRATRRGHLFGWTDCRSDATSLAAPYRAHFSGPDTQLDPDEFWALTHNATGQIGSNCHRVAGVARRALWQKIDMVSLSRCRLDHPTLPRGTTTFDKSGDFANLLPSLGWRLPGFDQTSQGIRASAPTSTLIFKLPPDLEGSAVRLVLRTAEPAEVRVTFGGAPVAVTQLSEPTGLAIEIPASLVDRSVQEALTLAFWSPTQRELALKVISIRAEGR